MHPFSLGKIVAKKMQLPTVIGEQRPSYPSSKPKVVDWDKLEAEVKKEVCL